MRRLALPFGSRHVRRTEDRPALALVPSGLGLKRCCRALHARYPTGQTAYERTEQSLPFWFAVTQTKIGRNDPCGCGSGRKFKKCCLKGRASAPSVPPSPDSRRLPVLPAGLTLNDLTPLTQEHAAFIR